MRERNACLCTDGYTGGDCGRDRTMRKLGLAAVVAASVATTGCATYGSGYGYDPYNNSGYYQNNQTRRAATGAAVGAVGGAVAGAIIPGVSTVEGAVAG